MASVVVSRTTALGGFRVDSAAVRDACALLGIEAPVRVKLSRGRRRIGATRFDTDFGGYSITVSTFSTPERATETLWHELTHCMQSEQSGGWHMFTAKYRQHSGMTGKRYKVNPYEVEARDIAAMYRDVPLVKA